MDVALIANFIECVLRIAFAVVGIAILLDLSQPYQPVFLIQFVERLSGYGIIKEFDANLFDTTVPDDSLEILFRQRKDAAHCHAACLAVKDSLHHQIFKNQIAMHQDDVVVFQIILGAINTVYVVGLVIDGIVDKSKLQRKVQGVAIIHQYFVVITSCNYNFRNPE